MVKLSATIKTAVWSLRNNLARSLLTILGIVIGIVAIVLVVALGQGAKDLVLGELETAGANLIVIRPGRQPESPADFAQTILGDTVTSRDIVALENPSNVPGIASVQPAVLIPDALTHQDEIYRPLILGWTAGGLQDFYDINTSQGTYFTDDDVRQRAKVIVLGERVKQELFGASNAVGQFVRLRGTNLRVVGVLEKAGQVSSFNVDELAIMPHSTAQKDLLGIDFFHEVIVRIKDGTDPEVVAEDIRLTLREQHDISEAEKDDFFVLTQTDITNTLNNVTTTLTIFLVAIASISLVVGGVGIMNIMLVSVTERTKEIGLRKAVGATNANIMNQFLVEAILLTGSGGVIGTVLAVSLAYLSAFIIRTQYGLAWPLAMPLGAVLLGIGTATAIGMLFGVYPARKAARKDPIEALRYE